MAANVKGIPLKYHFLDMETDEHEKDEYGKINPSKAIPTLVVEESGKEQFVLSQSIAIIEYLEERFPDQNPLLPPRDQPEQRARVRQLQNIITSDIAPPSNSRIAFRVRGIRNERDDQFNFVHKVMNEGFTAYEAHLETYGGQYSVGDQVTVADVCLVPAIDHAKMYKLDLSPYPRITAIYDRLMQLDPIKNGHLKTQEDTPEQYRN